MKNNGGIEPRRFRQWRAERDDLPLPTDYYKASEDGCGDENQSFAPSRRRYLSGIAASEPPFTALAEEPQHRALGSPGNQRRDLSALAVRAVRGLSTQAGLLTSCPLLDASRVEVTNRPATVEIPWPKSLRVLRVTLRSG